MVCMMPGQGLRMQMLPALPEPAFSSFRSEEHTSELQSLAYLVCRLLLEKKKKQEIAKHFDNPPLSLSVLGSTASIMNVTRDQLACYYAEQYSTSNIVPSAPRICAYQHF